MFNSPPEAQDTPILNLMPRIQAAFARPPDSAGILQGVRTLRHGKPHVRVVLVPSPKNQNQIIAAEGRLEAAMIISLELDPGVARFRGQPFAMPGPKGHDIVCDLVAEHLDGTYTVIDLKPAGALLIPSVRRRMSYAGTLLKQAHLSHRVFTEVDLERQPARQIRDQIRRGATAPLTEHQRGLLLGFIRLKPTTVAAVRAFAQSHGIAPLAIEKLALRGVITFRTDSPWSDATHIGDHHEGTTTPGAGWGTVRDVVVQL